MVNIYLLFMAGSVAGILLRDRIAPMGRAGFLLALQLVLAASSMIAVATVMPYGVPAWILSVAIFVLGSFYALAVFARVADAGLGFTAILLALVAPVTSFFLLFPSGDKAHRGAPGIFLEGKSAIFSSMIVMLFAFSQLGQIAMNFSRDMTADRLVEAITDAGGRASYEGVTLTMQTEVEDDELFEDPDWRHEQMVSSCEFLAPVLLMGLDIRIESGNPEATPIMITMETCSETRE